MVHSAFGIVAFNRFSRWTVGRPDRECLALEPAVEVGPTPPQPTPAPDRWDDWLAPGPQGLGVVNIAGCRSGTQPPGHLSIDGRSPGWVTLLAMAAIQWVFQHPASREGEEGVNASRLSWLVTVSERLDSNPVDCEISTCTSVRR
jgi:hypothetical protein